MFGPVQAVGATCMSVVAQIAPPSFGVGRFLSPPPASPDVSSQIEQIKSAVASIERSIAPVATTTQTRIEVFHSYIGVLVAAFLVTLIVTPIMRRLAVKNGIIDRPLEGRKVHRVPIAYLGGVAVFLGMVAGILFAATGEIHSLVQFHHSKLADES
jgi:hypothetical protein